MMLPSGAGSLLVSQSDQPERGIDPCAPHLLHHAADNAGSALNLARSCSHELDIVVRLDACIETGKDAGVDVCVVAGLDEDLATILEAEAKVELAERKTDRMIFEVRASEFVEAVLLEGQPVSPLQHRISRLFVAYNSLMFDNDARRALAAEGENDLLWRSKETFLREFGPPPWDVLNELLANQGLDFMVAAPGRIDPTYQVRLVQRTTGAEVSFSDLSSGEKVLMALAMSLYGTVEERHRISLPDLMLLDEVDAPLHPAMVRTNLRAIDNVFVTNSVAVILTTHSPTTVALSPEGHVLQMSKTEPRLTAVSNQRALTTLTDGPTGPAGRRYRGSCSSPKRAVDFPNAVRRFGEARLFGEAWRHPGGSAKD